MDKSRDLETRPELAVIDDVFNAIDNNDDEKLSRKLHQIKLNTLSRQASDTLLILILQQVYETGYHEIVPRIMDAWESVYPRITDIPFHVQLAFLDLDPRILNLVYVYGLKNRGVTYLSVMSDLIKHHETNASEAYNRVALAFQNYQVGYSYTLPEPSLDPNDITALLEQANKDLNVTAINYLSKLMKKYAPYQDIPNWVLDFRYDASGRVTPDYKLPLSEDVNYKPEPIVVTLPSDMELINLYDRGMIDTSMNKERFIEFLNRADPENKLAEFQLVLERLAARSRTHDTRLYRLYGPAMMSLNPDPVELSYGGSRMFLDISHPDEDEVVLRATEWFDGSCDLCFKRIRRRWHAVRRPIPTGGYTGCYCSWNCVRKSLVEPDVLDALPDADILTLKLIDELEREIAVMGIQDRRDDGDIIPESVEDLIPG